MSKHTSKDNTRSPVGRIRVRHPETSVITDGFDPELSVMSARPPIYPVSTYCFHSPEEAKQYFDVALGRATDPVGDEADAVDGDGDGDGAAHAGGLIYARLNNPNSEMFEDLMVPLEKEAAAAVSFSSGMAAISSVFLTFLRPGEVVLYAAPVYGGTDHLLRQLLAPFGITSKRVDAGSTEALAAEAERIGDRLAMVYLETPANPTLRMTDIAAAANIARSAAGRRKVLTVVDNTFLGPVFQSPLAHGADLCVYSATKYIGGHSDLVAGVVTASNAELVTQLKTHRAFFGTISEPFTAWLLQRSLATLYTRTVKQSKNATRIVDRFRDHPKLATIEYPTEFTGEQERIYKLQCTAPGSMISFDLKGGQPAAFRFLSALKIPKLAVSLGGVESLVTHPRTTTSSEMSVDDMSRFGIGEGLVRYSVGVEYWRDLADDIEVALGEA